MRVSVETAVDLPVPVESSSGTPGTGNVQPYWNPYVAGVGLGLVLLTAFVVMGRGLGASGAFTAIAAFLSNAVSPDYAQSRQFLAGHLGETHPLKAWLVFEVAGVFVGALASGLLAGRIKLSIEKGTSVSTGLRLTMAFAGGLVTAIGAALARGCTSGQALTGGALLNLGSWMFMLSVFGGAYALARLVRWQWR
jgi:uncharacterized protein